MLWVVVVHRSIEELARGVSDVRRAPCDGGLLRLIARRPGPDEREVLADAELDVTAGLIGDTWSQRPSRRMPEGQPHPDMQLTLMNARAAALFAVTPDRWALAGDQLYVDLHLGEDNLPAGTRLSIGGAVVEITDQPHTGCAKFAQRFGLDAQRFLSSPDGVALRLRGINARVLVGGRIAVGDVLTKVP